MTNCDDCGDLGAHYVSTAGKFLCDDCRKAFYAMKQVEHQYKEWTGYA